MGLKKAYDPKAPRKRKDWFYKTLEYLAQTPEPISVSELSRALNCSQPIIFKIFEQLENEWSAVEKHSWGKNNINLK